MGSSLDRFAEVETGEAFTLQNPRLLKVEVPIDVAKPAQGAAAGRQRSPPKPS